ncbi:hypothetical protein BBP40_002423 [Aspergillus hancockii]|nr:hypothetical protein BBP40_002423 [Aspergillus hancockii]
MAGVKRKIDSSRGSTTVPTGGAGSAGSAPKTPNSTVGDTTHVRVTRSLRASQDARANQTDNKKNNNTTANNKSSNDRPLSRIITLSTRAARANSAAKHALNSATNNAVSSQTNATRETRASRTRATAPTTVTAAAPTPSQLDGTSANFPETPRSKRVRRGPPVEETPRSTRQSARLRSHGSIVLNDNASAEAATYKQPEASPSKGFTPSSRTRNRNRQTMETATDATQNGVDASASSIIKAPSPEDAVPEVVAVERPRQIETNQDLDVNAEASQVTEEIPKVSMSQEDKNETNEVGYRETEGMPSPAATPSSSGSRKRRSSEAENNGTTVITSFIDSPNKKLKLEDGEPDRTVDQQLKGNTDSKTASRSPDDGAEVPKTDDESRQITEDIEESTPENATEPAVGKSVRGGRTRGRGRGGRSRAAPRFAVGKRGRGIARTARGGRTGRQYDRSSDVEHDRSPSPSAATQKLRDRQRELDKAFRKVAAAQRLALAVLASQSQKKLSRDKNAHKNVPEYEEISLLLKARLEERQEVFRREYELKVEQENRLFAANKDSIEERYRVSAQYIKEEHFYASQGEYMAFVEGRRAAEDDEHTETDGSETEPERVVPPAKEVVRGFNSSFVRSPAGAACYDRARYGWDDFVQRAKLGDDIDPQMKEMREAGLFAGYSAPQLIGLLLEATGIVEPLSSLVLPYPKPHRGFRYTEPSFPSPLKWLMALRTLAPLCSRPPHHNDSNPVGSSLLGSKSHPSVSNSASQTHLRAGVVLRSSPLLQGLTSNDLRYQTT